MPGIVSIRYEKPYCFKLYPENLQLWQSITRSVLIILKCRRSLYFLEKWLSCFLYDTCSVQLHIDEEILVPKDDLKLSFDLSYPGRLSNTLDLIYTTIKIPENGYILEPGKLILAKTKERVGFPLNMAKSLAGRIEGRSSFARTGLLVHFTAPTLHAGWKGHITLELLNHGPLSLTLRTNLAICQLIVETVKGDVAPKPDQQFDNQNTPSGSTQKIRAV